MTGVSKKHVGSAEYFIPVCVSALCIPVNTTYTCVCVHVCKRGNW